MLLDEAHESKLCQDARGHRLIHVGSPGIPPGASAICGGAFGTFLVDASGNESFEPRFWLFPLFPEDTAEFPPDPAIQFLEARFDFRKSEVDQPSLHQWLDGLDRVLQALAASLLDPFP